MLPAKKVCLLEMNYRSFIRKNKIRANKLELFLDYMDRMFDLYIHVIIDLPLKIEMHKLRQAMSLVAAQEPVISARYVRKENRAYWHFEDSPEWDIEEVFPGDDRYDYSPELITKPSHPESHFPISIRLIHLREKDRLHVRLSHILTDAGGSREFVYNLASAYRKILTQPDAPTDTSILKSRQFGGFKKCIKIFPFGFLLSGLILDKISLLIPADYFKIPMKICAKGDRKIVSLHINSDRFFRLKKCGKKKNATLNDIFLTAFSRALSNFFYSATTTEKQFGIIVTSDMRKYIKGANFLGNLSNWRILKLGRLPLDSQNDLLNNVAGITSRWKKNLTGLGNFLFNMAFLKCNDDRSIRFLVRKFVSLNSTAKVCRIGLTNLGLLARNKIDFGGGPCLDAYMYPPVGIPPLLIAGLSGCADTLCFSIGYLSGSISADTMDSLFKTIDQELSGLESVE